MISSQVSQDVNRLKTLYPTLTEYKGSDYAGFIENIKKHSSSGCVIAQSQEFKFLVVSRIGNDGISIYRLTSESKKKFNVQGNWLLTYGNTKLEFNSVDEVEAKYNEVVATFEKLNKESKEAWLKCAEYVQDWAESLGLASKKKMATDRNVTVLLDVVSSIKFAVTLIKDGSTLLCKMYVISKFKIPELNKVSKEGRIGARDDEFSYHILDHIPDFTAETIKNTLNNQAERFAPVIDILHLTEMKERLKDTRNYVPCQKKIYTIQMRKFKAGTIFFNTLEQASDIQKFGINPNNPIINEGDNNYQTIRNYCEKNKAGYICDGVQITLIGTVGEMWNTKPKNVADTYTLANGTELTEDRLNSMPADEKKVYDIQTKPNTEILYAIQVPKAIRGITVDVGWAVLAVNDIYAEHGNGDFILLSADSNGKPDLNRQRVINGLIFVKTYGKPKIDLKGIDIKDYEEIKEYLKALELTSVKIDIVDREEDYFQEDKVLKIQGMMDDRKVACNAEYIDGSFTDVTMLYFAKTDDFLQVPKNIGYFDKIETNTYKENGTDVIYDIYKYNRIKDLKSLEEYRYNFAQDMFKYRYESEWFDKFGIQEDTLKDILQQLQRGFNFKYIHCPDDRILEIVGDKRIGVDHHTIYCRIYGKIRDNKISTMYIQTDSKPHSISKFFHTAEKRGTQYYDEYYKSKENIPINQIGDFLWKFIDDFESDDDYRTGYYNNKPSWYDDDDDDNNWWF
jgi:hypothetical protein